LFRFAVGRGVEMELIVYFRHATNALVFMTIIEKNALVVMTIIEKNALDYRTKEEKNALFQKVF
jgi:hypothetical protein